MYLATITKDLINPGPGTRKGDQFWPVVHVRPTNAEILHGHKVRFTLRDDDGIDYYEGTIIYSSDRDLDRAVERLYEWGAYDAGTTEILVEGERWI